MWAPKGTPSVPRRPGAVSPMCLSHRKALRLRKNDGRQYPVFIREGVVRQAMWAAPWMWIPSMRTTLSRWCVLTMYGNLRETPQALVRVRSITIPSRPNRGVIPALYLVFQPSTHARNLVMPRPFAQRLSRAVQRLPSPVRVGAFSNPFSVGAVPRAPPGGRLLLHHVARTSARSRSATLVSQRRLVSIPTCTKPTRVKLCTRMTWLPLPSPT